MLLWSLRLHLRPRLGLVWSEERVNDGADVADAVRVGVEVERFERRPRRGEVRPHRAVVACRRGAAVVRVVRR